MKNTATTIDQILTALDVDADTAATTRTLLEALTPAQLEETLANVQAEQTVQTELRNRLVADVALRTIVAPHTSWGTAYDRYTVAHRAVIIVERAALQSGVTTDELVAAITANGDSIRLTIEMYGDPRSDGVYGSSTTFYAWRCRVRDGVATATADARKAAAATQRLKDDARWEKMGLSRCDRCGGAGGHDGWPGFTCFDCGGAGATA